MKVVLRNSALVTAANLGSAFAGFIFIPILVGKVGLGVYGQFVIALSLVTSIATLLDLQVWQPLTADLIANPTNHGTHVFSAFISEVCVVLVGTLVAFTVALCACFVGFCDWKVLKDILPLAITILLPTGSLLAYLRTTNRYDLTFLFVLVPPLLRILLFTTVKIVSLREVIVLYALSELTRIPFLVWMLAKCVSGRSSWKMISLKRVAWPWAAAVSDLPVTQLDRVIVGAALGVEMAAIYHVIKRIAQIFSQFAAPLNQVLYPELLRLLKNKDEREQIRIISRKIFLAIFSVGCIALAVSMASQDWWLHHFMPKLLPFKNVLHVYLFCQLIAISFVFIHPLILALIGNRTPAMLTLVTNACFVAALALTASHGVIFALAANVLQMGAVVASKVFICVKEYREQ